MQYNNAVSVISYCGHSCDIRRHPTLINRTNISATVRLNFVHKSSDNVAENPQQLNIGKPLADAAGGAYSSPTGPGSPSWWGGGRALCPLPKNLTPLQSFWLTHGQPDGDFLLHFCVLYLQRAACSRFQTCILNSHLGHTVCGLRKYGRHPISDR